MNIQSILLLALVLGIAAFALYRHLHRDSHCGGCDSCSGGCCGKQ